MQFSILAKGLGFPEAPRWHNGKFYFSDFSQRVVRSIDAKGNIAVVAHLPNQPSGLGWLPDGRMLIVSMADHKVMRQEADGSLVEHADISKLATGVCNDMVVDAKGRAYVGNFGAKHISMDSTVSATLAFVDIDGTVSPVAEGLNFPNGAVITADGKTLIIAETFARHLSAFDISEDGSLYNRRVWADITPHAPDGICQDSQGGIWVATIENKVIRVLEGGEISHSITTNRGCYACALGGRDGQTLFMCTSGKDVNDGSLDSQIITTNIAELS